MTSSSLGKFMVGALVGGAVGAVMGMLLAPRSGVETREMIKEEFGSRYKDSLDGIRDKADMVKEKASAIKDKVKAVSEDLEEVGRRTVSRFTDKPSDAST
jgi:gas vesicle protein